MQKKKKKKKKNNKKNNKKYKKKRGSRQSTERVKVSPTSSAGEQNLSCSLRRLAKPKDCCRQPKWEHNYIIWLYHIIIWLYHLYIINMYYLYNICFCSTLVRVIDLEKLGTVVKLYGVFGLVVSRSCWLNVLLYCFIYCQYNVNINGNYVCLSWGVLQQWTLMCGSFWKQPGSRNKTQQYFTNVAI